MLLSLDYDETYTRDPVVWLKFVKLMQEHGHQVVCITMRHPQETVCPTLARLVDVIYTNRKAKKDVAYARGLNVDVWIDDHPLFILKDAIPPSDLNLN